MKCKKDIRAPVGGTIGVNGQFYRGGQFLPNKQAVPGRWKKGRKWVSSTQEKDWDRLESLAAHSFLTINIRDFGGWRIHPYR